MFQLIVWRESNLFQLWNFELFRVVFWTYQFAGNSSFSKQANQAMELEIFRFVFEIESLHEKSIFYAIQSKKPLK